MDQISFGCQLRFTVGLAEDVSPHFCLRLDISKWSGFWLVVSCFQLYWDLRDPYCYFCNNWWKRCSLYQAASIFSFVSGRHWELRERHWRSEVLRLEKPVHCPIKIQRQGQYGGAGQFFLQKSYFTSTPFTSVTLSVVCIVSHPENYFSLCLSNGFADGFRSDKKKKMMKLRR